MININYLYILFLCFHLNLYSQDARKYCDAAIQYSLNNQLEEALNSIDKAIYIGDRKDLPLFYFHKYEYLVKLQKFTPAIKTLNLALAIFPNSILLLNTRAEFYLALKVYKKSIFDYEKITALVNKTELKNYSLKLASVKFVIRDFKGVSFIIKSILKSDPLNIEAQNLLAALHIEYSDFTKAIQILNVLAKQHPKSLSTIINLGYAYQKNKQHSNAITCFNRALNLSPNNPYALCNRAFSKFKISEIDGALLDINSSISLLPSNSYAYKVRGQIYLSLNRIKNACLSFTFAQKLNFSEQYGPKVNELLAKHCR
jgi:tetratricopeptide (TPR) repeat protein